MLRQWARMEHYRLHSVESWTDSPYKAAVLASIHTALEHLEKISGPLECSVCAPRKKTPARVLMFPLQPMAAVAPLQAA